MILLDNAMSVSINIGYPSDNDYMTTYFTNSVIYGEIESHDCYVKG